MKYDILQMQFALNASGFGVVRTSRKLPWHPTCARYSLRHKQPKSKHRTPRTGPPHSRYMPADLLSPQFQSHPRSSFLYSSSNTRHNSTKHCAAQRCAALSCHPPSAGCATKRQEFAELVLERDRGEESRSDGSSFSMPEVLSALRRVCLSRAAVPVLCGASLRGIGVEPLLDSVSTFLPSPLDRPRPTGIIRVFKNSGGKGAGGGGGGGGKKRARRRGAGGGGEGARGGAGRVAGGGEAGAVFAVEPLQNDLVAFVFKVDRFSAVREEVRELGLERVHA